MWFSKLYNRDKEDEKNREKFEENRIREKIKTAAKELNRNLKQNPKRFREAMCRQKKIEKNIENALNFRLADGEVNDLPSRRHLKARKRRKNFLPNLTAEEKNTIRTKINSWRHTPPHSNKFLRNTIIPEEKVDDRSTAWLEERFIEPHAELKEVTKEIRPLEIDGTTLSSANQIKIHQYDPAKFFTQFYSPSIDQTENFIKFLDTLENTLSRQDKFRHNFLSTHLTEKENFNFITIAQRERKIKKTREELRKNLETKSESETRTAHELFSTLSAATAEIEEETGKKIISQETQIIIDEIDQVLAEIDALLIPNDGEKRTWTTATPTPTIPDQIPHTKLAEKTQKIDRLIFFIREGDQTDEIQESEKTRVTERIKETVAKRKEQKLKPHRERQEIESHLNKNTEETKPGKNQPDENESEKKPKNNPKK